MTPSIFLLYTSLMIHLISCRFLWCISNDRDLYYSIPKLEHYLLCFKHGNSLIFQNFHLYQAGGGGGAATYLFIAKFHDLTQEWCDQVLNFEPEHIFNPTVLGYPKFFVQERFNYIFLLNPLVKIHYYFSSLTTQFCAYTMTGAFFLMNTQRLRHNQIYKISCIQRKRK